MMKSIFSFLAIFVVTTVMFACNDKGDDNAPCSEMALQVSTTPANGSVEAPAVGPSFPLTVTVSNGMPAMGVTIEVSAGKESGGTFFTQTVPNVKAAATNLTITGATSGQTNIVTVTVTSRSCATNKWTGSYRFSMK